MSLAEALSIYCSLNVLIVIGFGGLAFVSAVLKYLALEFSARAQLSLHYFILITCFVLSALQPLLPGNEVFSPPAKVWSAPSLKKFNSAYETASQRGYLSIQTPVGDSTLKVDHIVVISSALAMLLLLLGGMYLLRDLRWLSRTQRQSFLIRKLGRVRVYVNEAVGVPFCYWLPGQTNIVVPIAIMARRSSYLMAVAHEFQHHRQGDTRWVYLIRLLKWICFINPAVHLWDRWISEVQEFACDETLVDQKKVESQAYARCLIEVAQSAIHYRQGPVGATGARLMVERKLLKRRIQKMLQQQSTPLGRSIRVSIGLLLVSIMGASAYASKGLVQDRRVSMSQAKAMALRAQTDSGFPIVVNDLVLTQLNRFIGTPEGRQYMRNSLARMEGYRTVIGEVTARHNVPEELMAIPITESAYRNLTEAQSGTPGGAAGLWQFIPSTARNYGLYVAEEKENRVDGVNDQRLDVPLASDAAIRYLQSNNLRFKDWQLSVLAYNMGESAVQRGIAELRSRDAWVLIRNGFEGDKDYLPRVIAAIIVMRNPESVD